MIALKHGAKRTSSAEERTYHTLELPFIEAYTTHEVRFKRNALSQERQGTQLIKTSIHLGCSKNRLFVGERSHFGATTSLLFVNNWIVWHLGYFPLTPTYINLEYKSMAKTRFASYRWCGYVSSVRLLYFAYSVHAIRCIKQTYKAREIVLHS